MPVHTRLHRGSLAQTSAFGHLWLRHVLLFVVCYKSYTCDRLSQHSPERDVKVQVVPLLVFTFADRCRLLGRRHRRLSDVQGGVRDLT